LSCGTAIKVGHQVRLYSNGWTDRLPGLCGGVWGASLPRRGPRWWAHDAPRGRAPSFSDYTHRCVSNPTSSSSIYCTGTATISCPFRPATA